MLNFLVSHKFFFFLVIDLTMTLDYVFLTVHVVFLDHYSFMDSLKKKLWECRGSNSATPQKWVTESHSQNLYNKKYSSFEFTFYFYFCELYFFQQPEQVLFKGRDQWEWIGLWKVAIDRHLVRIVVINVHFYFNLAAILE